MANFERTKIYEVNGHRCAYLGFRSKNTYIEDSSDQHHFVYRKEDGTIVQIAIDTRCFDEGGNLVTPVAPGNHGRVSIPRPKDDGKDQKQFAERWHSMDEFLSEAGIVDVKTN